MNVKTIIESNKKIIIVTTITLVIATFGYLYFQNISKQSDIYNAKKLLSSSVKFDEKVDFDDVYNKHSFDHDSTDTAAKRIKESFLDSERKKQEELEKLEERRQFVLDSIKLSAEQLAQSIKDKERQDILERTRRSRKRTTVSKPAPVVVVAEKPKKVTDDDGFITDFGDLQSTSGLESSITNIETISSTDPDEKTLYWVNFSISKSQTVKSGTIVMFENQEELKIGSIIIPAFSKLQTRATLSNNRCTFALQKILTEQKVYNVSGELYDHNRTPGVSVNVKSDDNALLDGVASLGKSVLAASDPTNLANNALDVTVGSTSSSKYAELKQNLEVLVNLTIKK
jgi:hypothetical protein